MKDPTSWVYEDNEHSPIEHRQQRADNGFSVYDWWNFNDYLAWVIIQGLEKFKVDGVSHPVEFTEESWKDALNTMIEGFKAHFDLDDVSIRVTDEPVMDWYNRKQKTRDKGLALFAKYFGSLWD
jgi:hypothetical protein